MDVTLSVSTAAHQWLHHAGEADLVGSLLKFFESLGIEIFGRAYSQFFRGQVTDGLTVHRIVDGTGGRNDLDALLFKFK